MTFAELFALAHRLIGPGLYLILAVLAAEVLNLVCFRKLNDLGIVPREPASLGGVALAPLLHNNLGHFAANFLPLCLLSYLLGLLMPGRFWWITAALVLGTGLLVWLFARRLLHIGASGLIYGLFGYLTLHGFLSGRLLYVLVSCALLVLYSGIVWGVLPTSSRSSWESHLAGLMVGLALAWKVF